MSNWSRRNVLAAGALSAISAACSASAEPERKHIVVVGAGIIGGSIAYHLAKMGVQVTVLERHKIATRASRGTFAWLNATWAKQPQHYHRFNQLGLAEWKRLEKDLEIPIKWGGSIEWFESDDRQKLLGEQIAEQVEWGEPARMIGGEELRTLEPNVDFAAVQSAAYSPNDGALDPVLTTQILLDAAQELGATIKTDCGVKAVQKSANRTGVTVQTEKGEVICNGIVLATGADPDATKTLAGIDIPQRSTPGVIVVTEPQEPLLNRIVVAPGVHIHQRQDGRIVLGEQDGAPRNDAHTARLAGRPNAFPNREFALQHADRILATAQSYVPGIATAKAEDVYIGWRPLPVDGHPVIGFSPAMPNVYLAITHSGVSLAPIIGRLAAQELVEGIKLDALANYRPDRDFENVTRY